MNILFLLRLWPVYGGGETVTICLANEMAKRGWNVHIAYFKDSTKERLPYIVSSIKAFRIGNVNCDEFFADEKDFMQAQNSIIRYITEAKIDVVINQWWPSYYISRLKNETSAKIVTCLHQAFYTPILDGKGMKNGFKKLLRPIYTYYKKKKAIEGVKAFLPYVDKYVFLSPSFQTQFENFAKYDNSRGILDSVPNPLVYSVEISDEQICQKENMVLLVGRMLEGQKRITKALKIWQLIEKDLSLKDWSFYLVGEGPDLLMYKTLSKELKLKRVHFEGYQNPMPYYERAKIFLMTSAFEGFGMTLIEAQQMGVVPVVMDSYLSLHDIIDDGKNGCIVPNDNIQDFVEKVKMLMNDKTLLKDLRKGGLKSCLQFSVSMIVDRWENLICTLIN